MSRGAGVMSVSQPGAFPVRNEKNTYQPDPLHLLLLLFLLSLLLVSGPGLVVVVLVHLHVVLLGLGLVRSRRLVHGDVGLGLGGLLPACLGPRHCEMDW